MIFVRYQLWVIVFGIKENGGNFGGKIMSEVTIKFKIPEEECDYKITVNAMNYYRALEEIDNYCRGALKWEEHSAEVQDILEKIREMIPELID